MGALPWQAAPARQLDIAAELMGKPALRLGGPLTEKRCRFGPVIGRGFG